MISSYAAPSVASRDDVLALLPREYRLALDAPIRDALVDALFALIQKCDDAADFAAAQSDPGRAEDIELDGALEDRNSSRAEREEDETFRERSLSAQKLVTMPAIRDAVNAILATVTDATCRISDGTLDRWFVGAGSTRSTRSWHSYISRSPSYPERLFDFPEGAGVPGNDPGGARAFNGTVGRLFLLRVPDLSGLVDAKMIPSRHSSDPLQHARGAFFGQTGFRVYLSGGQYDLTIYRAIINTVSKMVGHSVRWIMFADPKLT